MDALVYGYDDNSLEITFILCPLTRLIVAGSHVGPVICLTIGSYPYNGFRYWFHLVERDLNLVRKWLIIPILFMQLLLKLTGLGRIAINLASRVSQLNKTDDSFSLLEA